MFARRAAVLLGRLQKKVAGTARKALQTASVVQQQRQEQEFDECMGLLNNRGDSVAIGAWEAGRQRLQQYEACFQKLTSDVALLHEQVTLLNREVGVEDGNISGATWSAAAFSDAVSQRLSSAQDMGSGHAAAVSSPAGLATISESGRQGHLAITDLLAAGSEVSTAPSQRSERHLPTLREENAAFRDRLNELERGKKKVLAFAQQALKTTVDLQKQQKEQKEQQDRVNEILGESLQPALAEATQMAEKLEVVEKATMEFRKSCAAEVADLKSRVNEVQQAMLCGTSEAIEFSQTCAAEVADLHARVNEVQQALSSNLASQQLSLQDRSQDTITLVNDGDGCTTNGRSDDTDALLQGMEARVDRRLAQMLDRIQAMQDAADEQHLTSLQVSRQVPEVARKVEQLWTQCQHYFSQVKAHEVHLSFVREEKLKALECSSVSSVPRSASRCESDFAGDFADEESHDSLRLPHDSGRYNDAESVGSSLDAALAREGVGLPWQPASGILQKAMEGPGAASGSMTLPGAEREDPLANSESQKSPSSPVSPASPSSWTAKHWCVNDGAASDGSDLWGGNTTRRSGGSGEAASHSSELWGGSSVFTGGSHQIVYANSMGQCSSPSRRGQTSPEEAYEDGGRWLM